MIKLINDVVNTLPPILSILKSPRIPSEATGSEIVSGNRLML